MTILKTEGLGKRFGSIIAVEAVDFEIAEGELVGLIGPNGAGKTTFFNLITGYHKPTSGTVHYRGDDITGMSPHNVAKHGIARTFQVPKPLNDLSVLDNVTVGAMSQTPRRAEARQIARETLDRVNYPGEYDEAAATCNVAQLKRLEIAKAVATDPDMLMLDEVVAGLNQSERQGLVSVIRKLNDNGMTILMVEHIMDVVMNLAERVMVLNEGRKIAEQTPKEIQKNEEVIEVYLGGGK